MPFLTVFTPTFNREHLLSSCYNSLLSQSDKDFEWLIIDDGSTDNTRDMVEEWMSRKNGFPIRYIYQKNGGLSKGYNTAIRNMDTELSICIDSDDSLYPEAVAAIREIWNSRDRTVELAGIIGLDLTEAGRVVGHKFNQTGLINPASLMLDRTIGDKKYVVRNDLLRSVYPIPVVENERHLNPHYLILQLSKKYQFIAQNQPLCIVDYQPDGMSSNIWNNYLVSPKSFFIWRRLILELPGFPFWYRYKTAIHSVSSLIVSRDLLKHSLKPIEISALPLGLAMSLIVEIKGKKRGRDNL